MNFSEMYSYAQMSLASYGMLSLGIPKSQELKSAGLAEAQAQQFASQYTVIDQKSFSNGLSATIFQDSTCKQTIAIHGTNDLADLDIYWLTCAVNDEHWKGVCNAN